MLPPNTGQLTVLGSMATRGLLAELAAAAGARAEAAGGVDVARRVAGGEAVDVVVLAAPAMRRLEADGHLRPGTLRGVAVSAIAVAVRTGTPPPDLATPDALRRTLLAAGRVGYSTGPSGDHLLRLLDAWDLRQALAGHLVQAPPGIPVGRLLAEGAVDLAVQQRSELMNLPGVAVAGPLPPPVQAETLFTAGIPRTAPRPDAARALIDVLAAPGNDGARRRHGLEPAPHTREAPIEGAQTEDRP